MELDEVPETPVDFRSRVLLTGGGIAREHYDLGVLEIEAEENLVFTEIIPILEGEGKLLVAVPGGAWHRSVTQRYLPRNALSKATLLEVAAVEADDMESLGGASVKIWMGYLEPSMEPFCSLEECDEPGLLRFADELEVPRLPTGEALIAAANEHFAFQTATSGAGVSAKAGPKRKAKAPKVDLERRVMSLEENIESIKDMLQQTLPGGAKEKKGEGQPGQSQGKVQIMGLDPGIVAAAKAQGVPEDQLRKVGALLQKPNRMSEDWRGGTVPRKVNVLSESEEEEDAEEAGGEEGKDSGGAVEKAVVQLTKLVTNMTKNRGAKKGLEGILDKVDGGGAGGDVALSSSGGGRSKAAAYTKLKSALLTHPNWIVQSVEQQMEEDFNSFRSQPGAGGAATTSRAWVEHRSRIGHYPSTIRAAWMLAGIHDCLKNQDYDQARARCCLSLAAIDQSAMDAGNWTLAQEFLLEVPPPYGSFAHRRPVEAGEQQSTRLVDERFLEVMMWRLKDRDSFHESKKRLSAGGKGKGLGGAGEEILKEKGGKAGRPTPKVKAKGGATSSQQGE